MTQIVPGKQDGPSESFWTEPEAQSRQVPCEPSNSEPTNLPDPHSFPVQCLTSLGHFRILWSLPQGISQEPPEDQSGRVQSTHFTDGPRDFPTKPRASG